MNKPKALEKAEKHFAIRTPITGETGFTHGPVVIEREVKKFVKEIILEMDPDADIFMPVQSGYGATDLDFIVGIRGYYLAIETKANGKKPTHRQLQTIEKKKAAEIPVLILDQSNLYDLAFTIGLLGSQKQLAAWGYANSSRTAYLAR